MAAVTMLPPAGLRAQSDLDSLMAAVLSRRDDNWKKLQQYTLTEDNTFRLVGPMETPIFGSKREYLWMPRQGFFIRSPVSADGVAIGEVERRKAEDAWLKREQLREARRAARRGGTPGGSTGRRRRAGRSSRRPPAVDRAAVRVDGVLSQVQVRAGHYAFVGRERLLDRDVLRIEYYPEKLFQNEPREVAARWRADKPPTRGGEGAA